MRSNMYSAARPAAIFLACEPRAATLFLKREEVHLRSASPDVLHAYTHIFSSYCLRPPLAARVGIMQKFTYEKSLLVARIINREGGRGMRGDTKARENDGEKNLRTREVREDATMKIIKMLLIVFLRFVVPSPRFVGVSRFVTWSSFLRKAI